MFFECGLTARFIALERRRRKEEEREKKEGYKDRERA